MGHGFFRYVKIVQTLRAADFRAEFRICQDRPLDTLHSPQAVKSAKSAKLEYQIPPQMALVNREGLGWDLPI